MRHLVEPPDERTELEIKVVSEDQEPAAPVPLAVRLFGAQYKVDVIDEELTDLVGRLVDFEDYLVDKYDRSITVTLAAKAESADLASATAALMAAGFSDVRFKE